MKRLLLILSLLTAFHSSFAQIKDDQLEHMMTERVLTCDDVYYNSIQMIPRLFRAGKYDTAEAVANYWQRNCGMNESSVAFSILNSIRKRTFKEELVNVYRKASGGGKTQAADYYRQNILSYLTENYNFYDIQHYPEKYSHFYFDAYIQYSNFIRSMAGGLIDEPGLSPVEKFLVQYYADPNPNRLVKLKDSVYNNTLLQKAYMGERTKFGGMNVGLVFGMWVPNGQLSFIGSHPYLGAVIGGCTNRILYDFTTHVRFGDAPTHYNVRKDDSLYSTNHYTSYYFGWDMGYAFARTKHHEFSLLGGVGFDGIDLIANTSTTNTSNGTSTYSLNLNGGLGYKFFLKNRKTLTETRHSYLNIQAKYNAVSYRNVGGTDLTGNTVTISLVWGTYIKVYHKYYDKSR